MLGTPPMPSAVRGLVQRLQDWPVASQQQARRNAMVATTACAQRRIEREDVADYLAELSGPAVPEVPPRPAVGRASHA